MKKKTLFDPVTEMDTRFRVKQLRVDYRAGWGKTTAPRVLIHMTDLLGFPLGDAPSVPVPETLLTRSPLARSLYLSAVPCPDRKELVAREVEPADIAAWPAAVQTWQEACSRFATRGRRTGVTFRPHPLFGALSTEEWGYVVYAHTDHHLRQFGV